MGSGEIKLRSSSLYSKNFTNQAVFLAPFGFETELRFLVKTRLELIEILLLCSLLTAEITGICHHAQLGDSVSCSLKCGQLPHVPQSTAVLP